MNTWSGLLLLLVSGSFLLTRCTRTSSIYRGAEQSGSADVQHAGFR